MVKSEKGSLKCDQLTSFWMTWSGDKVRVGKGVYIYKHLIVDAKAFINTKPTVVTFWSAKDNSADLLVFMEETDHTNYCSNDGEPTQGLLSGWFKKIYTILKRKLMASKELNSNVEMN